MNKIELSRQLLNISEQFDTHVLNKVSGEFSDELIELQLKSGFGCDDDSTTGRFGRRQLSSALCPSEG